MIENIKSRKIYRICTNAEEKKWDRIYFLTNAASVDAADGQSLEDKVGQIKGITNDTKVSETGWAADMTTVAGLSDRIGTFSFGYTEDGKPGFREEGADTVTPFSTKSKIKHYATTAVKSGKGDISQFNVMGDNNPYYEFPADGLLYIYGDAQKHSGVTASIKMTLDNKTINNSKKVECKAGQKLRVYGSYNSTSDNDSAFYFITYTYVY